MRRAPDRATERVAPEAMARRADGACGGHDACPAWAKRMPRLPVDLAMIGPMRPTKPQDFSSSATVVCTSSPHLSLGLLGSAALALALHLLGCRPAPPDPPEASGLFCFNAMPGYLDCSNSEAECAEFREGAIAFHVERGAAPEELDALLGACQRVRAWCYRNGEGHFMCTESEAECEESREVAGGGSEPCTQPTSVP